MSINNINQSEARLGELTRSTFLSMWSYQNPYYSPGKELCDVLVIFEDYVIIMSDKFINFGEHADPSINWRRWYKKAVSSSIRQLHGAINQIKNAPDRIYSDPTASSPFPLRLPSPERMRILLVAVANGSEGVCIEKNGHPGLKIDTRTKGDSSFLTIGLHDDRGTFLHVINKTGLDAIFKCLDTTRDFIDYLERKEVALSQESWVVHGEENLVAGYMQSQAGHQPFSISSSSYPLKDGARFVASGLWESYLNSTVFRKRKEASYASYVIDRIIEHVSKEYENHKMIIGQDKPFEYHESAFRLLARESRLGRMIISTALRDIWLECTDAFWSSIVKSIETDGLYYLWLLYPKFPGDISAEKLEKVLHAQLDDYMWVARSKFPDAKIIFGICLPNRECEEKSRIFKVMDGDNWNKKLQERALEIQKNNGILSGTEEVLYVIPR